MVARKQLAVVVVLSTAVPAFATDTLTIRKVDTTAYPTVKVSAIVSPSAAA